MATRRIPEQIGDLPRIGRPATRALLHAGITTLAGVAALPRREVEAMHGVGPTTIAILDAALAARGMSFAP